MKQGLAMLKQLDAAGIQVRDLENDPEGDTMIDAKEVIKRRASENIKKTLHASGATAGRSAEEIDAMVDAVFESSKTEKELQQEILKVQNEQLKA